MSGYGKFENLEFHSRREIRETRSAMLAEHLRRLRSASPYYKKALENVDLNSAPLESLPITDKKDIESDPYSFLAVPKTAVAETVTSSGTTGAPLDFHFTNGDLKRLAYNERRALSICGITADDTVLLTCTLDRCFIAGLAYYSGCRSIGATAIRAGAAPLETHLDIIKRLEPDTLVGVPSFLLKLAELVRLKGVAPESLAVKRLVCIGEPLRGDEMERLPICASLEDAWNAKAYSTYASTETTTAFCECSERSGGHLIPELGIVEILDDDGNPADSGTVGEVVVTPFHIEAMPLLRYRTGDMAFLIDAPCPCGRNTQRLGPILGRKRQMIKCKGTSFYPNAVYAVLDRFRKISEYQIRVRRKDLSDDVSVAVAIRGDLNPAEIEAALSSALRVKVRVRIEPEEDLRRAVFPSSARKPIRLAIS